MRKVSYSIKVDQSVLDKAKKKARRDNRSVNNYIENAIIKENESEPKNPNQ